MPDLPTSIAFHAVSLLGNRGTSPAEMASQVRKQLLPYAEGFLSESGSELRFITKYHRDKMTVIMIVSAMDANEAVPGTIVREHILKQNTGTVTDLIHVDPVSEKDSPTMIEFKRLVEVEPEIQSLLTEDEYQNYWVCTQREVMNE